MNNLTSIARIFFMVNILLLMGCSHNKNESVDSTTLIVDYQTKETDYFEDFFDIKQMSIIQFKDDNPIFLSDKLQIEFAENYLFVFDKGNEQLYRFDHSGKLLNKIGQSGHGPAEYNNAGFFGINENQQTLSILCDNGSSIMIFDYAGNFIKKFATPLIVTSFAQLNSNLYYYYTGYYNSPNNHRLHKADSANILESYLPLQTQAFDMIEMNFTPKEDYGYFRETFFPSVYKYNISGIQEIFKMDFGSCEITQQMLEEVKDPVVFFETIRKDGFCSTTSVLASENTFYVTAIQQDIQSTQVSHFYINLADSFYTRVICNKNKQAEIDFFNQLKPIYLDSEGFVYYLTNSADLKAFMESKTSNLQADLLPKENLNPLIISVPLKNNKQFGI